MGSAARLDGRARCSGTDPARRPSSPTRKAPPATDSFALESLRLGQPQGEVQGHRVRPGDRRERTGVRHRGARQPHQERVAGMVGGGAQQHVEPIGAGERKSMGRRRCRKRHRLPLHGDAPGGVPEPHDAGADRFACDRHRPIAAPHNLKAPRRRDHPVARRIDESLGVEPGRSDPPAGGTDQTQTVVVEP
jgi:hypothetical protein